MDYTRLYNDAYAKIGSLTPLPTDCGKLCGVRCCQGDSDAGMILFPYERPFIENKGFQLETREMCGYPVDFAVCHTPCRRIHRPLSCRIFPLAPKLEGNVLRIIDDPRAKMMCPLLSANVVTEDFRKAVYDAFALLMCDPEIETMLRAYSAMLQEFIDFFGI